MVASRFLALDAIGVVEMILTNNLYGLFCGVSCYRHVSFLLLHDHFLRAIIIEISLLVVIGIFSIGSVFSFLQHLWLVDDPIDVKSFFFIFVIFLG